LTCNIDAAAMDRGDVLHDRESEASPALCTRSGLIDAVEALEEPWEVARRDPRPLIVD
jgi:hypothetical protein